MVERYKGVIYKVCNIYADDRDQMEDYCQEQTGMGLVEYSTQVMAEAPEPPTGPAM